MGQRNQGIFSIEKTFAINRESTMALMRLNILIAWQHYIYLIAGAISEAVSVCSHQKLKKMQNRRIAQNAARTKMCTAHIALVRMFTWTHAVERYLHSDWLAVIYSRNATSSFAKSWAVFNSYLELYSFKAIAPFAISRMANRKWMGVYRSKRFIAVGVSVQ